MLSMTILLFIYVMHMNNVLQIWEVSTYLQSKYASHGHMYEVFYSFVLVFESKTHTRTALHVSIAKKNARPNHVPHKKQRSTFLK